MAARSLQTPTHHFVKHLALCGSQHDSLTCSSSTFEDGLLQTVKEPAGAFLCTLVHLSGRPVWAGRPAVVRIPPRSAPRALPTALTRSQHHSYDVGVLARHIPMMHTSHNQNPVLKWSTQNHVKSLEGGYPQLFMVGIVPHQPSSTRVLIVAQVYVDSESEIAKTSQARHSSRSDSSQKQCSPLPKRPARPLAPALASGSLACLRI